MKKKIIIRISNEIGNQMFMFASAFSISKKMDRTLFIDNESAFLSKKNISKYGLNNFNIKTEIAGKENKFTDFLGYFKRKFLKRTDFLRSKKCFYIEPKNKDKISSFNLNFLDQKFSDDLFIEGHFESEKYFIDYKDEILSRFNFIDSKMYMLNPFYSKILDGVSVGICLRQNRFSEGKGKNNHLNKIKSEKYTSEQVNYINKSVNEIKKKLDNPKFYLWSNDLKNLDKQKFEFDFLPVDVSNYNENLDKRLLSLFLLKTCKHFIVIPSTFNWWGAWLSNNKNKIIMRPSEVFFSDFKVNNTDFWPSNWIKIT